jgi:uncharacterized membrane protein
MPAILIPILEGLALSFVDMFIRHPDLKRIFDVQLFHRHITSDIPGNPHCFDYVLISLYNTLPEPSNFNMVWTNVHYREPIIMRGRIPTARINSLTCYTRPGGANYPCSVDLAKIVDANGRFQVFIAHDGDKSVKCPEGMYQLNSADWVRGFICMRNYAVPPGTVYETPEIVRAKDDKVLRKTEVLVAGSPIMKPVFMKKTAHFLVARIVTFFLLRWLNSIVFKRFVKHADMSSFKATAIAYILMLVLNKVWTALLYRSGRKRLFKQTAFCTEKNKFYLPDEDQAANGSQPCTLHKYWIMQYDIPEGSTLSIKGVINPADQKYWSIVLYDENGVSMPQYAHDMSARKMPVSGKSEDGMKDDKDAYSFDVRIMNEKPPARPHKEELSEPLITKLYISKKDSKGYVMFRRVHPTFTSDAKGNETVIPRALRVPQGTLLRGSSSAKSKHD